VNGTDPIDSELLAKYLANEAETSERNAVERWTAASPANAQELERSRLIWEGGASGSSLPAVDTDAAWARLSARMDNEKAAGRVVPIGGRVLRYIAAAAVLVGLIFGAKVLLGPASEDLVADASPITAKLSDRSSVVLSAGSRIKARMGDQRKVTLHGQAYFEVKKDAGHPFVVTAEEMTVTVLGTAFEVTAYDTASSVQVRVREGRVQVVVAADTVVLVAGEHVRFDRRRAVLEREAAGPVERWGMRILQFEQAPLALVAKQVRERYGVEVDLANEAIGRCALTATFEEEPVDVVLQVIAETFGLHVRMVSPGRYSLEGDGC